MMAIPRFICIVKAPCYRCENFIGFGRELPCFTLPTLIQQQHGREPAVLASMKYKPLYEGKVSCLSHRAGQFGGLSLSTSMRATACYTTAAMQDLLNTWPRPTRG